jgi:hypothetical protein
VNGSDKFLMESNIMVNTTNTRNMFLLVQREYILRVLHSRIWKTRTYFILYLSFLPGIFGERLLSYTKPCVFASVREYHFPQRFCNQIFRETRNLCNSCCKIIQSNHLFSCKKMIASVYLF